MTENHFVSLSKFPVGRFLPLVIEGGLNNEFDCMVFAMTLKVIVRLAHTVICI